MKSTKNNTEFKIESGIPMPKIRHGRKSTFPWQKLEPGQSFFVPDGNVSSLKSLCYQNSSPTGRRFRALVEGNGVRVWRTE